MTIAAEAIETARWDRACIVDGTLRQLIEVVASGLSMGKHPPREIDPMERHPYRQSPVETEDAEQGEDIVWDTLNWLSQFPEDVARERFLEIAIGQDDE